MKRSGKAPPPATTSAAPPAEGPPADRAAPADGALPERPAQADRSATRPTPAESVAGEEDPGSALEQFSDLMQDSPARGGPAAEAAAPQPTAAGARPCRSDGDAQPSPAPRKGPDRRA